MGHLHYNEVGNHIEVMLGIQEGMTMTDPMLAHMTGWREWDTRFLMVTIRK